MKKMMNPTEFIARTKMLKEFMAKKISLKSQDKISHLFGDTPESEKEALAQRVIDLMEQGKRDEELLKALELE